MVSLPLTRASGLRPLITLLDELGAPTTSLLERARLPTEPLAAPEALLPLHLVHAFVEHAAGWTDIADLGRYVGQTTSAYELGAFGQLLKRSVTVYDYLRSGMQAIGAVTTSERFWLTREGKSVRFHHFQPGLPGRGRCHNDLYVMAVTLNMLRAFLGAQWQPEDLRLLAPNRDLLGDGTMFGDVAVRLNQPHSSFLMPASTLGHVIPGALRTAGTSPWPTAELKPDMPSDLVESLEMLVAEALPSAPLGIEVVAEAAGTSPRTLQRQLKAYGLSYRDLVQQARMRVATELLGATDMPVMEIAAVLGYRDPAHFTRAFRARAGLSPRQYRSQHC